MSVFKIKIFKNYEFISFDTLIFHYSYFCMWKLSSFKERLHFKYNLNLTCGKIHQLHLIFYKTWCITSQEQTGLEIVFSLTLVLLISAPHPPSLCPFSSHILPLSSNNTFIQLPGGGPKSKGKYIDDKGQRVRGWGAKSRRMRVIERTILSPFAT